MFLGGVTAPWRRDKCRANEREKETLRLSETEIYTQLRPQERRVFTVLPLTKLAVVYHQPPPEFPLYSTCHFLEVPRCRLTSLKFRRQPLQETKKEKLESFLSAKKAATYRRRCDSLVGKKMCNAKETITRSGRASPRGGGVAVVMIVTVVVVIVAVVVVLEAVVKQPAPRGCKLDLTYNLRVTYLTYLR